MNAIDQLLLKADSTENNKEEERESRRFNFQKLNATSVLIPIIFFELLVCVLGAKFYQSIGYHFVSAAILAITIEVFYMYFSAKSGLKSHIIRGVLLLISVITLSYSAYTKDKNVQNHIELLQADISDSKQRLFEVNTEISSLKIEKAAIERDMELFREYKKATKGNQILAPRRIELKNRRSQLLSERKELKQAISKKGKELVNQSIFSNMAILSIQTLVSILAFTIVQLAICLALPDVLKQIRES